MSLAAIVGGTASKLGGGKFANGAVSGAFVHMYNYTAHASEWLPKEGNRVEKDYPILGKINNVSRGISKFLNTIGDAFSGGYHGAGDAIQNAHPAAQAVLGGAVLIVAAPILIPASEYATTQAIMHPEAVIYTGEVLIPIADGAYGGTPPNNIPSSIGKGLGEIGVMP